MKIQYLFPFTITLGLLGCSNSQTPVEQTATETAPASVADSSSNLPADAPTYKVASTGKGAPMTVKDENGNLSGVDIDVIKAIGEREGFKVDFVPTDWNVLFTGLDEDKYDILISGISWSAERESKYGVSQGYFFSPASFAYIDKGNSMKTLADLKGLKVGALANSKHEKTANNVGASKVVGGKYGFEIFTQLVQGDIDAMIHEYVVLKEYQKKYPDQKITIQSIEDESQKEANFVIITKKSNQELLNKINSGISKLKADGTIEKITEKYLATTSK